MRFAPVLAFVIVALSRAAATEAQPRAGERPSNPSVEFLLTSAATDFHEHGHPSRVRHVRAGYATGKDGTKQYRLCGEYLPAETDGKNKWTPFVTIQTSGYEQWVGDQHGYCSGKSITWDKGDWSSELQSRLDALK